MLLDHNGQPVTARSPEAGLGGAAPSLVKGMPTIVLPPIDGPVAARADALADCQRQLEDRMRETALLEAQLQARSADVEAARAARDAVLRNVSHELRTPLNHILGGIEVMLRANPDDKQEQWLGALRRSAGDLLGMINRLLDLSRLQSEGLRLESVAFDPREVLADVQVAARDRASQKGLDVVVRAGADLPPTLVGSPTRLAQALLEYVDNAVKFTGHGRVTLSAKLLGTDARGHHLRFTVSDTGQGIEPEVQSRLFSAFGPGDSSIRRANGGLGNGLAIVRAIARAMGGDAGVESAPGAGSQFWLTACFAPRSIPAPEGRPAGASATPANDPDPGVREYPTPQFVTLGEFDVDRQALRGSFRVALDELLLPERFRFAPNDAGWSEWMPPVAVFPEGGVREFPVYTLDADTEAAVTRALHSAVPRLLPAGRDPLSGLVRGYRTPAAERAFDPPRFLRDMNRLLAPGFTVTVSTLP